MVVLVILVCVCLHVPVNRSDVVAGEHASETVTASLPPVGVGVVQDLDVVSTPEAKLPVLLGVEVKQRLHIGGVLQGDTHIHKHTHTLRVSK